MTIREVISAIEQRHKESGITLNQPATEQEIMNFERKAGFQLPSDFKEFYKICNGFSCTEDIFNIISLGDALQYKEDYGKNWFRFAEYMIYSDVWTMRRIENGGYEIFFKYGKEIVLTNSLQHFLERFLQGNVFETGGLYDWHEEMKTI